MKTKIITIDNVTLTGTLMKADKAKAVVLINPGTATKTSFYRPFAEFLKENDFHVFLWNYRGFCESKTYSLENYQFNYSDIGRYDIPSVIDYLKNLYPELPLFCIGHSAGGQQIGLAQNYHQIKGLIAIAVSAGFFSYMPFSYRLKANFFFRFFVPLTSLVYGYVPASKMNFMEDLPTPLSKEWGNWCGEKELFFSKKYLGNSVSTESYKKFDFPIEVIVSDDDEISTPKNIDNFWKNVRSSKGIQFHRYNSNEFPEKKIGHFGYFKKSNIKIWHDVLQILDRFSSNQNK